MILILEVVNICQHSFFLINVYNFTILLLLSNNSFAHSSANTIQDLLKLERLQEDLVERCGGLPTFAQWAAVAGVDQKTLRKR